MNYRMYIIDQESNEVFDVSTIVHEITHSTTLQGQPGKLNFTIERDPNNDFQLSIGSVVRFWSDDVAIFHGYVFNIKTSKNGDLTVIAYDQMRYLQNHDYLLAKDMNLQDIFKKICEQTKINYQILGQAKLIPEPNIEKYHFADVSYFDIIQSAINESNVHNTKTNFENKIKTFSLGSTVNYLGGKNYTSPDDIEPASVSRTPGTAKITQISNDSSHPYHLIGITSDVYGWCDLDSMSIIENETLVSKERYYFIRDNFGTLELNDIENNAKTSESIIIGDESLLTDYEYELDIDKNTYNELYLMQTINKTSKDKKDKNKINRKLVIADQVPENVAKWGVLRKIVNIKRPASSQKELEEYMKLSLSVGSQISKTLKIDALGYDRIIAGDSFILSLKRLGLYERVYVISATHHYDSNKHTMTLEVSTSRNLVEVLK